MSLPPFLTDAEITDITDPLTQGYARIKFFQRLGVKVSRKPNGQPLVGRTEFEINRQSVFVKQHTPEATVIDFTKLQERIRSGKKTQRR
jgi:hypothetical protein